ncbi:MAG: hypothetical protein RBT80_19185 [Candidatus Vecturithrix sp.]|jgi:hypothetical protein|nr:hypothetical protein [Candidatus Vecturithrix sp.]
MPLHSLELEIAAEELLVKKHYLDEMQTTIDTAFTSLTEESDAATIAACYDAYETVRGASADYSNIRLPVLTNTELYGRVKLEAAE